MATKRRSFGSPREDSTLNKIFIRNIPETVSPNDLLYIFRHAGECIEVYIHPLKPPNEYTWGTIQFATNSEVQFAIEKYDKMKPYNFDVSKFYSKHEKEFQHPPQELHEDDEYYKKEHNWFDGRNNTKKTHTSPLSRNSDSSLNKSKDSAKRSVFIPRKSLDKSDSTASHNIRVTLKESHSQFTDIETPEGKEIEFEEIPIKLNFISKEKRDALEVAIDNAVLNMGKDKEREDNIGRCTTCKVETINTCSQCQTCYCSRSCQLKDWPQHMKYCKPIPDFDCKDDSGFDQVKENKNERPKYSPNYGHNLNSQGDTYHTRNYEFKNYKKPFNDDSNAQTPRGNRINTNRNTNGINDSNVETPNSYLTARNVNRNSNSGTYTRKDNSSFRAFNSNDEKHMFGEERGKNERFTRNNSLSSTTTEVKRQFGEFKPSLSTPRQTEITSPKQSNSFLKIGEWTEVCITEVIDKGLYYIHNKSKSQDFMKMMDELQDEAIKAEKLSYPGLKDKCIVFTNDLWFRGLVKSVSPLLINLVDYGMAQHFKEADVRKIPDKRFVDFPRMAIKIKIQPGNQMQFYTKKCDDVFQIKPVFCDYDTAAWLVDAMDSNQSSFSKSRFKPSTSNNLPAIVDKQNEIRSFNKMALEMPINFTVVKPLNQGQHIFPPSNFTEVIVTIVVNGTEAWVQKLDDMEKLQDILTTCNKTAFAENFLNPKINDKCVAEYSGDWYRGIIVSISPLKVFFIDYGNEEEVSIEHLRDLPTSIADIQPLGYRIRLADGTLKSVFKESGSLFSIKPIKEIENNITIIQVKGYENSLVTQPSTFRFSKMKSIINYLKVGDLCVFSITKRISNDELLVSMACDNKSVKDSLKGIEEKFKSEPTDKTTDKPSVGDIVAVKLQNTISESSGLFEWHIGVFHHDNKYYSCNNGSEIIPLELRTEPSENQNEPIITAVILKLQNVKLLENDNNDLSEIENGGLKITAINSDGLLKAVLMNESEQISMCTIYHWQPGRTSVDSTLKSGSLVVIGFCSNYSEVYVNLVNDETIAILNDFNKEFKNGKPLVKSPEIGDIVACMSKKMEEWCRAEIIKKVDDTFTVTFVDYGNTETTTLSGMKSLSPSSTNIPKLAIKVGLANKLDKPFNEAALEFLSSSSLRNDFVKIEFKNNDLTSVELFMMDGTSLNEKINDLVDPNWRKPSYNMSLGTPNSSPKATVKTEAKIIAGIENINLKDRVKSENCEDKLTEADLPKKKLKVDCELELMLIMVMTPRRMYFWEAKTEIVGINDDLTKKLKEHCSSSSESFFKPNVDELCAAYYKEDDSWYRAVCLEAHEDEFRVRLIDFGNEISLHNSLLRKLNKDFTKHAPIGVICDYEAIPVNCSNGLSSRLPELVKANECYTAKITGFDGSFYTIDIPAITQKLQNERLL